jgi:hypothetical protein
MFCLQLFERTLRSYNTLYRRKAYIENFKSQPMFEHSLDEFDDSRWAMRAAFLLCNSVCATWFRVDGREVLEGLIAEYRACATPDYGSWDGSAATSGSLVSGGAGGGDDGEAGGFGTFVLVPIASLREYMCPELMPECWCVDVVRAGFGDDGYSGKLPE